MGVFWPLLLLLSLLLLLYERTFIAWKLLYMWRIARALILKIDLTNNRISVIPEMVLHGQMWGIKMCFWYYVKSQNHLLARKVVSHLESMVSGLWRYNRKYCCLKWAKRVKLLKLKWNSCTPATSFHLILRTVPTPFASSLVPWKRQSEKASQVNRVTDMHFQLL